jgi:hypothetical protein
MKERKEKKVLNVCEREKKIRNWKNDVIIILLEINLKIAPTGNRSLSGDGNVSIKSACWSLEEKRVSKEEI